jgi:hypothetical protein
VIGNGNIENMIYLPTNKHNEVVVTGALAGYINDPLFFEGYNLTGILGDKATFTVPVQILSSNSVRIDGVFMWLINFNLTNTPPEPPVPPVPPVPPTPPIPFNSGNVNIAQIVIQPEVNAEEINALYIWTENISQALTNWDDDYNLTNKADKNMKIIPICSKYSRQDICEQVDLKLSSVVNLH